MVNVNCNCDIANMWKQCEDHRRNISIAKRSFQELKDERRKLVARKAVMDKRISNEENRGFRPMEPLRVWIESIVNVEQDLRDILAEDENALTPPDECCGGFCYNDDISAYQRGAQIVEGFLPRVKALFEEKLIDAEMFTRAPVDYLPVDETIGMDNIFDEVWQSIAAQDPQLRVIRICGMPGVGKTALLKRLHNEFQKKTLGYTLVIWVDASISSDVTKVQLAIAEKLGMTSSKDDTQQTRARSIHVALKKESFVLFINDPKKDLTLKDVGIPTHHDDQTSRYKVVFDTRDGALSLGLGGDLYYSIEVNLLTEKYAWKLFEMSVGQKTLNAHPDIPELAMTVADICDRLPLTLVTLGLAMQRKTAPEDWLHAIKMLENYSPRFEDMANKVYREILISYEGLEYTARQCFLYCSLFPRECSVNDEELLDYWLGENFLMESELDCIRNEGHHIINSLCNAHLLEKDNSIVKMHDAIRGSALWIAAGCQEQRNAYLVKSELMLDEFPASNMADVEKVSLVRCQVKSLNQSTFDWSKLSTLILKGSTLKEISTKFFQRMVFIKVLDLSGTNITEFPATIAQLSSLHYLNLSYTFIPELPNDVKNLVKLKLLDLSHISALQKIPTGVIRSLTDLQVLNMFKCGSKHGQTMNERISLSGSDETLWEELKDLRHLQDLRITVTSNGALQSFGSSTKLHCIRSLFVTKCGDSISLQFPPVQNLKDLKVFHIVNCPKLEDIKIRWDVIDEEIAAQRYRRQGSEISSMQSFKSLAHVEINLCWQLKNLTWLTYAPNLESLSVQKCMDMNEVVGNIGSTSTSSGGHADNSQLFSRLKSIHLIDLPELSVIYRDVLPFPYLEEITVLSCPKLSKLPLDITSAKETLKSIRGQQKWWDNLQWKNDADKTIKTTYLKYFRPNE